MNTVLSVLVGTKALIYLDDTVIWGATLEEHKDWLKYSTADGSSHLSLNLTSVNF
jgi:hypothetical protein